MVANLLPVIFFLSGVAALLFENLWFYEAGITFGNSVWASSLVLAGFMGGLALGNALAARLKPGGVGAVRNYALLELAIGVFGFALVVGLPALTSAFAGLFEPVLASTWAVNALRLGFAFALLLVPSTAMGATLPVMVSALYRHDPRFGRVLGRLYGWNTLGAVVGALAGDLLLIEALGVRGTGIAAAAISLSVAATAFGLSKRFDGDAVSLEPAPPRARLTPSARGFLITAGLAGFSLLGLELVWFRFLLHFMFGSSQAFAILLATVLAGIGAGGLAGGLMASSQGLARRLLPGAAMLTGTICIALYLVFPAGPIADTSTTSFLRAASLMLPVAFLSGVLFTLLGDALKAEEARETRAAGLLTLANTTGAMIGPLLVGFVLLPTFGIDRCIQMLAGVYLIMGLILLGSGARPTRRPETWITYAAGVVLAGMLVSFPAGPTLDRHLRPILEPYLQGGSAEAVARREGLTETIIYIEERAFEEPVAYRMLTNGYSMSGTVIEGLRYMKLFVYLPMALNPDAKSALLISYGVGSTAKALTDTRSLESIDVVDISRDVLEMNNIVYPDAGTLPLDDPRVVAHVEDGRYFLQTTKKRFDLITGEPPPPKMAGIVTLYTREYFSLVYDRLTEGGIATYWLPTHVLMPDDSKAIIRAFCDVFEDCSLWSGAALDWILVGTRNATGPGTAGRFAQQWADPVIGPDLALLGIERPEQMGALFMAGADDLRVLAAGAEPLTDDRPKRLSDPRFDVQVGLQSYVPWMDPAVARQRFERSPWIKRVWPADLRSATLDYFATQWEANRLLIETRDPPLQQTLPKVHTLLTTTRLATLPLWLLDSDGLRQVAAQDALDKGQTMAGIYWELGLGALSRRSYAQAYQSFVDAARAGGRGTNVTTLTLYALFMANDPDGRQKLLDNLRAAGPEARLEPWVLPFLESIGPT